MKKLFNKFLKVKEVYVVETKSYNTTKEIVKEHFMLKNIGLFSTNEISIYRNEQEAKDAIERKIDDIKNNPMHDNIKVFNQNNGVATITYSIKLLNTTSSFRIELRLIKREIK